MMGIKVSNAFCVCHVGGGGPHYTFHHLYAVDVIMDMLGSENARTAILNYYQNSDEPQAVENAIEEVRSVGRDTSTNKQGNQR